MHQTFHVSAPDTIRSRLSPHNPVNDAANVQHFRHSKQIGKLHSSHTITWWRIWPTLPRPASADAFDSSSPTKRRAPSTANFFSFVSHTDFVAAAQQRSWLPSFMGTTRDRRSSGLRLCQQLPNVTLANIQHGVTRTKNTKSSSEFLSSLFQITAAEFWGQLLPMTSPAPRDAASRTSRKASLRLRKNCGCFKSTANAFSSTTSGPDPCSAAATASKSKTFCKNARTFSPANFAMTCLPLLVTSNGSMSSPASCWDAIMILQTQALLFHDQLPVGWGGVGWDNNVLLLSCRHRHCSFMISYRWGGVGRGGVGQKRSCSCAHTSRATSSSFLLSCRHRHCSLLFHEQLPVGWSGLGWENNLHVPVHTQAQQPHHLSCCPADTGTALSWSVTRGVGWDKTFFCCPADTGTALSWSLTRGVGWDNNVLLLSCRHRHCSFIISYRWGGVGQ